MLLQMLDCLRRGDLNSAYQLLLTLYQQYPGDPNLYEQIRQVEAAMQQQAGMQQPAPAAPGQIDPNAFAQSPNTASYSVPYPSMPQQQGYPPPATSYAPPAPTPGYPMQGAPPTTPAPQGYPATGAYPMPGYPAPGGAATPYPLQGPRLPRKR